MSPLRRSVFGVRCSVFGGLLLLVAPLSLVAQILQVGTDPLTISADEYGTLGVTRMEQGAPVPQYYSTFAKGSVLFLNGADSSNRWGNGTSTFALWDDENEGRFIPLTHSRPDGQSILTVFDAGESGVQVAQTVSYTDGASFYTLTWVVTNQGEMIFRDVRFLHGGDVAYGGEDFSLGGWDGNSNRVFAASTNEPTQNWMGLNGEAGSAAVAYYEDHFQLVRDACKAGALPGTVRGDEHDAAYALQWVRESLAPGESWTVVAREQWSGQTALPPVHQDVTDLLEGPLFAWQLSYQTGTYFGQLTLENTGGLPATGPFWCVLQSTADRRFMHPSGTLPDGREYVDVTSQVEAALADGRLDPGDRIQVANIEVYMRYRQTPPESAFSIWATAAREPASPEL